MDLNYIHYKNTHKITVINFGLLNSMIFNYNYSLQYDDFLNDTGIHIIRRIYFTFVYESVIN
jgi:hypothetical protein